MFYIYKILCLVNNKIYIGQTINYKDRFSHHKSKLKRNCADNKYLQEDYNKYGLQNFKFEVIEQIETREQALERETYWMNYYNGIDSENLYNMQDKYHRNEEFIELFKGSNNPMFQKKMSNESRKKMSLAKQKYKGENHPRYGKHLSDETKQKISESEKGKTISVEQREKISRSLKNFYRSKRGLN